MVEQSEGGDFPPKMTELVPRKHDFTPPIAAPAPLTFRASGDGLHPQPPALERLPLFDQYAFRPLQPWPPAAHSAIAPMTFESPGPPRPNTDGREGKYGATKKKKQCSCKNSTCLKLYCECFAAGIYCDGCKCVNCRNNNKVENEKARQEAIEATLARNPHAFRPKIACDPDAVQDYKQVVKDVVIDKHSKGCHCKKSGCLKRYCECFQANIPCSDNCKCVDCKNKEESEERRALSRSNHASNTASLQQAANAAIFSAIGSSGPPIVKKRKGLQHSFGSTANDPLNNLGHLQKENPVETYLPSSTPKISGSRHSSSGMLPSNFTCRSLLADIIGPQDLKDLCSVLVVYSAGAATMLADERSASGRPTEKGGENHLASPGDEWCNQKVSSEMTPGESDSGGADVSKGRPLSPATLALMCDEQDSLFTTVASQTGVSGQNNMCSQRPSAEGLSEAFSEQERMVLTRFRDCLSKLITMGEVKVSRVIEGMSNLNGSDQINTSNQQHASINAFSKAATTQSTSPIDQLPKEVIPPLENGNINTQTK